MKTLAVRPTAHGSPRAPDAIGGAEAVEHSPLGDKLYDLLWRRIVTHRLKPGDKLSDLRLSAELGVSRTPVREALQRLARDGIVRAAPRRGFFVATFSPHDVEEIYDIRTMLEVLALRLALPHLTRATLTDARCVLDAADAAFHAGQEGAGEAFLAVDRAFHASLAQASRNRRLAATLAQLQAQIGVFQVYGLHLRDLVPLSIRHHRHILDGLLRADRTAAESAMERHIQEVKAYVLATFVDGDAAGERGDVPPSA